MNNNTPFGLEIKAVIRTQKLEIDVWSLDPKRDPTREQGQQIGFVVNHVTQQYIGLPMGQHMMIRLIEELRPAIGPVGCVEIKWTIDSTPHPEPEKQYIQQGIITL